VCNIGDVVEIKQGKARTKMKQFELYRVIRAMPDFASPLPPAKPFASFVLRDLPLSHATQSLAAASNVLGDLKTGMALSAEASTAAAAAKAAVDAAAHSPPSAVLAAAAAEGVALPASLNRIVQADLDRSSAGQLRVLFGDSIRGV
jgi:hypothetical protein